jgi:hypothetical protein
VLVRVLAEQKRHSQGTLTAFILTLLGAVISTILLALSIWIQLTIRFPDLIANFLEFLIPQYLLSDAVALLGLVILFAAAIMIYQRIWPFGGILAIIGAIITLNIIGAILGFLGGIIGICSRPLSEKKIAFARILPDET